MARNSTRGVQVPVRPEVELPEETLFDEPDSAAMRRVLLASLETFAELGFHATATRDIARRAAVSPAGLYAHYSSKQELLEHIVAVTHDAMLQRMRAAAEQGGTTQERLQAVVTALVRFHAKYNTACRVANNELGSMEADARARIRKVRQAMEKVVSDLIHEGVDNGEFVVDDQQIVTTYILSLGIDVARWFRAGHRLSPDELADLYAKLMMKSVAVPTPTPTPKRPAASRAITAATRGKSTLLPSASGR